MNGRTRERGSLFRNGKSILKKFAVVLLAAAAGAAVSEQVRAGDKPSGEGTRYDVRRDLVYSKARKGLLANVYVPRGAGPFPAVITIHGGSWARGDRRRMKNIAVRLADAGFTTVNIEYSLTPKHTFPTPLHDVKAAVRWLKVNARSFKTSPDRIGVFGYSAGAHLALLAGLTSPRDGLEGRVRRGDPDSRIKAVVAGAAPTDLRRFPAVGAIRRLIGGGKHKHARKYKLASPITHVSSDDPPVFLFHGRGDWVVPVHQSRRMAGALKKAGVPFVLREIPRGHATAKVFNYHTMTAAIAFLKKRLK